MRRFVKAINKNISEITESNINDFLLYLLEHKVIHIHM